MGLPHYWVAHTPPLSYSQRAWQSQMLLVSAFTEFAVLEPAQAISEEPSLGILPNAPLSEVVQDCGTIEQATVLCSQHLDCWKKGASGTHDPCQVVAVRSQQRTARHEIHVCS